MSDGETADRNDRPSVAVLAPDAEAFEAIETLQAAGGVVKTGIDAAPGADLVVALGGDALATLAAAPTETPVLPLAADDFPETDVTRMLDGEYAVRRRPLVAVEAADESAHALFDVTLTTAETATISEFSLDSLDESRESPVARFRADGVAVTTPAGSHGYAHAAGGPVVVPGSDVLAVVPISPFATDPDHWILPLSGLSLTVERDDADVELLVDGQVVRRVEPGAAVRLTRAGALPVVSLPESGRE